jgi:hypothetical protein
MVAGVIAYSRVKRNDPARADEAAQAAGLSEWAMSQERRPDPIAPTTPSTDAISTPGAFTIGTPVSITKRSNSCSFPGWTRTRKTRTTSGGRPSLPPRTLIQRPYWAIRDRIHLRQEERFCSLRVHLTPRLLLVARSRSAALHT